MNSQYARAYLVSPIGRIAVVADGESIVTILFDIDGELSDASTHNPATAKLSLDEIPVVDPTNHPEDHPLLAVALQQLGEYFNGDREVFDLPLAPEGTAFQREAWNALQRIPFGETISYGEQASAMGDRRKARAVGAANGKNPIPIVIPCHRVVGADGSLTGFAGGVGVKAWLLAHEQRQARLPV